MYNNPHKCFNMLLTHSIPKLVSNLAYTVFLVQCLHLSNISRLNKKYIIGRIASEI